ncbi:MAG: thymidine phosphorylase [Treponemataceae bacterium]
MRAVDIIMKKRGSILEPEGQPLSKDEIKFLIENYVNGQIPDYQLSAWLMAVYFNGMNFQETADYTECMLHSGEIIDLSPYKGPFVDKHSTGGVGDKISLPLAPIVAANGVKVPMMSGRALGHTGGTLDKLESIDGFNVNLEKAQFIDIIQKCGFAMIGQTKKIVPSDRLLYALRDVTGTVESIPLITASILSKKIAEGADSLVFDVKYGSGAFMKTKESAFDLAKSLVNTAKVMGKKANALITNMNTPLGLKVGNFLEIEETMDILEGKGPKDTTELTYELGALMLTNANQGLSKTEALKKCQEAVKTGKAMELFLKNIELQGGNVRKLLKDRNIRRSKFCKTLKAEQDGYIKIDAFKCGLAGVNLGVGRNKTEEKVFAESGFILYNTEGDLIKKGDTIMEVFGKNEECFLDALPLLKNAVTYFEEPVQKNPLIEKEI